ncbi:MAG: putative amidohydrolase [Saprospiraceae bacterium]|jgi:predicted amidohydrolase
MKKGADIVHFCEGALSGYTKEQLGSPENINFGQIRLEITSIQNLARKYKVWIVLVCIHELSEGNRPHNSLYIISDEGEIINRYDKRKCSNNEITNWYTPGFESCTFSVKGIKFGCMVCIEVNFTELFVEAEDQDVQCILYSSYSKNDIFGVQFQGYAATHNYWISMSIPKNESKFLSSQFIGPDGRIIKKCIRTRNSIIISEINIEADQWNISIKKAKPWRKKARAGEIYKSLYVNDERSTNKTIC